MGQHAAEHCDGSVLECALRATPAFAPDGSLWLAVSDSARVHVLQSANSGRSFARPVEITRQLVRLDQGADARPALAVGRDGAVTVGFATMTDRAFTGEVFYSHSSGGRQFSAPRAVSDSSAGKRFLTFAADPAGERLFAAWIDKRGLERAAADDRAYAGAGLAVAWSQDGGASFGETRILQDHTCECCRIGLRFAAPGQPVLVWRNLFGPARDHAVLTYEDPATPGAVRRVSDDDWQIDACPHHGPGLSIAGDGTYHVTWFTAGRNRQGLFYAYSRDGGSTFSEPMPVGTPGRQPARPQVLATGGAVWLAWQEFDGERTTVMLRLSRDGGTSWSTATSIAASAGMVDHPILVTDSSGRGYLSWLTRPEGYRLIPLSSPP